jgi:hypothetical protein
MEVSVPSPPMYWEEAVSYREEGWRLPTLLEAVGISKYEDVETGSLWTASEEADKVWILKESPVLASKDIKRRARFVRYKKDAYLLYEFQERRAA